MARTIGFLGYGYVARALGDRLAARGWTLRATARSAAAHAAALARGAAPFAWTADGVNSAFHDGLDAALISVPPANGRCPAFAAAAAALRAASPAWIGYLSATSVYGDCGGAWIDETAPVRPAADRGRARAAAESQWREFAAAGGLPLTIFRIAGIYGPGRSAIEAIGEGRAQRIVKAGQVFNRIHIEDIARALEASIANPGASDVFNLSDDEPAPPQDVVDYACRLLGVAPPPLVAFEEAALTEMAKSFYAENKRVSNARLKARLLPHLLYPTYREGLAAILGR